MKAVRIAELKARLSEYPRAVRRGETIASIRSGECASPRSFRARGQYAPGSQASIGCACAESRVPAEALGVQRRRRAGLARDPAIASMIAYVDASVLLRVALRQRDALPEWRHIDPGRSERAHPDREPAHTGPAAAAGESLRRRGRDAPRDHPPSRSRPWSSSNSTRLCSSAPHSRCRPNWAPLTPCTWLPPVLWRK